MLVRRWQAAKRQRRVRQTADGRQRHRDRERQRRDIDRQNGSNAASTEPASEATQSSTLSRVVTLQAAIQKIFVIARAVTIRWRARAARLPSTASDGCRRAVHRVRDRGGASGSNDMHLRSK